MGLQKMLLLLLSNFHWALNIAVTETENREPNKMAPL